MTALFSIYEKAAKDISVYLGIPKHSQKDGVFWQTHDSGSGTEYSSIGPYHNEVFTTYTFKQGTHHIRFLAYVSPDILLVAQSKLSGFYRLMDSPDKPLPIDRTVKDELLKGSSLALPKGTTSKSTSTSFVTTSVASTKVGFTSVKTATTISSY